MRVVQTVSQPAEQPAMAATMVATNPQLTNNVVQCSTSGIQCYEHYEPTMTITNWLI